MNCRIVLLDCKCFWIFCPPYKVISLVIPQSPYIISYMFSGVHQVSECHVAISSHKTYDLCFFKGPFPHLSKKILNFLDIKSLANAELVSKAWRRIITANKCWKKHLLSDKVHILG